jgi:hypothetical protein
MAYSTLTVSTVIDWLDANTNGFDIAATPSSETLALMQRCLDAAVANVEATHTLPATPNTDIELAIIMLASRWWLRRNTPNGISSFGDFGAVRVTNYDPDITMLLAPYKLWEFGS